MSVKRIQPLPTFAGVGTGQTATADIPIGPRYHVLWLMVACAEKKLASEIITQIRVKINGKVNRAITGAQLDALNVFNGSIYGVQETLDGDGSGSGHVVSSMLPIFFAEPWRKQVQASDGLAWATGNLSTLQVEFDLAGSLTDLTLSGFCEVDNSIVTGKNNTSQQASMGMIVKWWQTTAPITGTRQDLTTFPRRDYYQQISFFDANITDIEILVENFSIRKVTKEQNDAILVSREMLPVADRFDVVFDHDDILDSALPMMVGTRPVSDFQLRLNLSDGTARAIPVVYQTIGAPE